MTRTFDLMELILTCEEAFEYRYAEDEDGEGRLARCAAMARAFGIQVAPEIHHPPARMVLLVRPGPPRDDDGLTYLLGECLRAYKDKPITSPFSGMKEGTESIIALYQRFGSRLGDAAAADDFGRFERALDELAVATAALLWHLPENAMAEVDFLGPRAEDPRYY